MKFEDYKDVITDQYGFQFVKNNIMIGTEERRCLVCGSPTKYIEVCSEAHFCSDECVKEFDKQVAVFEKIGTELEEKLNRISTMYQISEYHAGCYLSNYEDEYICHKYNGGCKNISKCKEISDEANINDEM